MSVDREELRQRVEALRRELPEGAPVVPVATVRARDRAEVRTGVVFDLGLATSAYGWAYRGDYFSGLAHVQPFRGLLTLHSMTVACRGLEPQPVDVIGPHGARAKSFPSALLLACDEVDEEALIAPMVDSEDTPPVVAVLTPTQGTRGIDALTRALETRAGTLAPEVTAGPRVPSWRWLSTPHSSVLLRDDAPGAAPLGLLFLGGDDLAHARERARLARELLRT